MIVMCLVILVPFIACVHSVVVFRLPRAVLLMPPIHFAFHLHFTTEGCITRLIDIAHALGGKGFEVSSLSIIALQDSQPQIPRTKLFVHASFWLPPFLFLV